MIKIQNKYLDKFAKEHYKNLKFKLEKFPNNHKYNLEEVITAKPQKLNEITKWAKDKKSDYTFMIGKYKNFATKKREYNAYDLAEKLKINVCPYCNINSIYTVKKQILRSEFDHFYDKENYPILALSFYNLIPSCHTCNSILKGTKSISLNPYLKDFDMMASFELKIKDSKFYYDCDGFDIELISDNSEAKESIKTFKLNERYKYHKDIVLELIQKNAIYNDSYLDELMDNYEGTLFKNIEDLQRLISSGYVSKKEIGKRPLSKLIKDISKELRLI